MQLKEREAIIQKIVEESNQASKEAGKQRVLVEWRAKLEKEPILFTLYQIDEIVRAVRERLRKSSRRSSKPPTCVSSESSRTATPHPQTSGTTKPSTSG